MRYYDLKSGKRFDMHHPTWMDRMRNKDGSIKQKMDWKLAEALEADGIIALRPSTTEVAKIADSAGAFGAGATWGAEIGIDSSQAAWLELFGAGPSIARDIVAREVAAWKGRATEIARATMDEPRDIGSDLHDAFHRWKIGDTQRGWTADHDAFVTACCAALESLGVGAHGVVTEIEFCCCTHGGTTDLLTADHKFAVDWKTVRKFRKPKVSEIIQMGGYRIHWGFDEAAIVYYHQSEHKVRTVRLKPETLALAEDGFRRCLSVFTAIENIESAIEWRP